MVETLAMLLAIAACAALLGDTPASGVSLPAVEKARGYLFRAIASGADWRLSRTPDTGHGPVNHLVGFDTGVRLAPHGPAQPARRKAT